MRQKKVLPLFILLLVLILSSCQNSILNNQSQPSTGTQISVSASPAALYIANSIPTEWVEELADVLKSDQVENADLIFSLAGEYPDHQVMRTFTRVYAVAVPFDTVADEITVEEVKSIWEGEALADAVYQKIILTQSTQQEISKLWGEAGTSALQIVSSDELTSTLWQSSNALSIVPFEQIEPKMKILKIGGVSPLDKPMNLDEYPLAVNYSLYASEESVQEYQQQINDILSRLPATNRDESKMTVVLMTGTTAITRVTTNKIEINGYEYPGSLVKPWFDNADIRHVSNEVSFWSDCPDLDPYTMRFCSKLDEIKVLEYLGINVVESTGNHLNDYGVENFASTLQMYTDRGWLNYGGGINQEQAKAPVTLESNGNKIAFIGCNKVGFTTGWATETSAGAAQCEYDYLYREITRLKSEGYVVIATYQFDEIDLPMYDEYYRTTFKDAARAGADIVQGSQSHTPMGFDFIDNSIIHYGLGNFIFDQMEPINVPAFIDRHIIYDGKYINTELLTTKMMNWARPTPMTVPERTALLDYIFRANRLR